MGKLNYLVRSAIRATTAARLACPNCHETRSILVERKYGVTALRRCSSCLMMYRTPNDDPAEAAIFYNDAYTQGFTTDCPAPDELDRLKATDFAGQHNDYSYYISVLRDLGAGPSLFDFGCSWGYGSYQFAKAGFDVRSYEISKPRAAYAAANLGVRLVPSVEEWAEAHPHSVDVFFSSHVLEHVPSPSAVIKAAQRLLKPGGLFVAFFPNGSAAARARNPQWSQLWGQVHPNFLDDIFLNDAATDRPRLFGSSPVKISPQTSEWLTSTAPSAALYVNGMQEWEMFFAFRA